MCIQENLNEEKQLRRPWPVVCLIHEMLVLAAQERTGFAELV